eukprot:766349-Hanusia_phi.AAC.6
MAEELLGLLLDIMAGGERVEVVEEEDVDREIGDSANIDASNAGREKRRNQAVGSEPKDMRLTDRESAKTEKVHARREGDSRLAEISSWLRSHPHVGVNGREDSSGITALCMAAAHGRGDVTRLLLEEKADVNMDAAEAQIPATCPFTSHACEERWTSWRCWCKMVLTYHVRIVCPPHGLRGLSCRQLPHVNHTWSNGCCRPSPAIPTARTEGKWTQGTTPLIAASGHRNIELLKTILKSSSHPEIIAHANNKGNTALHVASLQSNLEGCEVCAMNEMTRLFLMSLRAVVDISQRKCDSPE